MRWLVTGLSALSVSLATAQATAQEMTAEPAIACTEPDGWHVAEVDRSCPLGGEKYKAFELGTHSTFGRYLDMTQVSYLQFPIAVPICPSNGFPDYQETYSDDELAQLTAIVGGDEYKSLLGHHTSWYLFAKAMEIGEFQDAELWWLYSRAAAEASNCAPDLFSAYAAKARDELDRALSDPASQDSHWPMTLMAANYSRRLGNFEDARTRITDLEVPEDWQLAFETLAEAIDRASTAPVKIGEFQTADED